MVRPARGFTLIELLSVAAVAAVLLAVGIPGMQRMLLTNRLAATSNALVAAFHLARQTAVARNRPVTLCPGDPATGCSRDWTAGTWLQFVDRDHDGRLDTGEPVLQSGAVADALHIAILGNRPMRQPIVFMPQGQAEQASGAFAAGTLRICVRDAIQPNAVDLILSRSGRVRAESRDLSGDCPFP